MSDFMSRVASAPISWGVCEVPGWGAMLPTQRVLGEMADLGLRATELGAPGFLPDDPTGLRSTLSEHGMTLLGAFTPLVLHDRSRAAQSLESAMRSADRLAKAGAGSFITAVVLDDQWSVPRALTKDEHQHLVSMFGAIDDICAEHGLQQVLHPHIQTLVETKDDVNRVLDSCDVSWCLDTGHLALGGVDPVAFARESAERVGHVHLKDVRLSMADSVLNRQTTLMNATQDGLFTVLGEGDVDIAGVVTTLEGAGYRGWYVIEQDTAIVGDVPGEGQGPVRQVSASMDYLTSVVVPLLA